jgi:hypothetical protein
MINIRVTVPFSNLPEWLMPENGELRSDGYWTWCYRNLDFNHWNRCIGINLCDTYQFENSEDAVAFKLRFGI